MKHYRNKINPASAQWKEIANSRMVTPDLHTCVYPHKAYIIHSILHCSFCPRGKTMNKSNVVEENQGRNPVEVGTWQQELKHNIQKNNAYCLALPSFLSYVFYIAQILLSPPTTITNLVISPNWLPHAEHLGWSTAGPPPF